MSTVERKNNLWIALKAAPGYMYYCDTARLNNFEFISATIGSTYEGVIKYNSYTDCWTEFMRFPSFVTISSIEFTLNPEKQRLYMYCGKSEIYMIDLKSEKVKTINTNCSDPAILIHATNSIHAIDCKNHWICNENNEKRVQSVETFSSVGGIVRDGLFLKSKNIIILFVTGDNEERIQYIWTYSILSNKYTKLKHDKFTFQRHCAFVLTMDENVIICMDTHVLHVLDLINISMDKVDVKNSTIRPSILNLGTSVHIGMSGGRLFDKKLVMGYVKNIFKGDDQSMIIPMDLMNIVLMWYPTEMLHIIEWNNKNNKPKQHYAIYIFDILGSMIR